MAALATIIYNNETIQAKYAPSLNAAFKELRAASGITPIVTAPDGGARTAAEQQALASVAQWWLSDHYEDNAQGYAAIDLWNQRSFRNWDEARFLQIMAKYGWFNIDISGSPFPSEPWHFANHGKTSSAALGVTLIDEGEEDMAEAEAIYWLCNATSADGEFVKDQRYRQEGQVGFPFPYPLTASTTTAMVQQHGGYPDKPETPINGNDLSAIAAKIRKAYPAAGAVPVIDYTKLAALVKFPTASEVADELAKRLANG